MGKNKKNTKNNVFKVAGAKSLKRTKAKAVNLGLKNIKEKIENIDAQFMEISKTPITKNKSKHAHEHKKIDNVPKKAISKEDVAETAEKIVKMDL